MSRKRNVDLKLNLITTRNIQRGQELYCCYGFLYWVSKILDANAHQSFYVNNDRVLTYQIKQLCGVICEATKKLSPRQLRNFRANYSQMIDIEQIIQQSRFVAQILTNAF